MICQPTKYKPQFRVSGIDPDILPAEFLTTLRGGPFPDGDFWFQHDLSPIHTSLSTKTLLAERCIRELPWPPKGDDVNIVENIIKSKLATQELHRASPNTLWETVQRGWNDLRNNDDLVLHFYGSLPHRIQSLTRGEGKILRY